MMKTTLFIAGLLIAAVSPSTLRAQGSEIEQSGAFSGVVYEDPNGNEVYDDGDSVIGGAIVTLIRVPEEEVVQRVVSGPDGSYTFGVVPPGFYRLRIQFPSGLLVETEKMHVTSLGDDIFYSIRFITREELPVSAAYRIVNPANVRGSTVSPFAP